MRIEIAATDTHALLWYAQGLRRKLGPSARGLFAEADAGRAVIYVPTLALVEVGEAIRRGEVRFADTFSGWVAKLLSSRRFIPVDLTLDVLLRAEELYGIPERGDRLIAATAAHLGYPLITRDPEIAAAAGVEVVW